MFFKFFIILNFLTSIVNASEHGSAAVHHPTPWDLKWKFITFIFVFGGIAILIKKSIGKSFLQYAEQVKEDYDIAEEKDKEAQIKLEMYIEKNNNLKSYATNILDEAKSDSKTFEEEIEINSKEKIQRIYKESESRLLSEKQQLIKQLDEQLVNKIVENAKKYIGEDLLLKDKITKKLMEKI